MTLLWVFFQMKGNGPGDTPEKDVPQVKSPEKPKVKLPSISSIHTFLLSLFDRHQCDVTENFGGKKTYESPF